jgi:hypothetical protein
LLVVPLCYAPKRCFSSKTTSEATYDSIINACRASGISSSQTPTFSGAYVKEGAAKVMACNPQARDCAGETNNKNKVWNTVCVNYNIGAVYMCSSLGTLN